MGSSIGLLRTRRCTRSSTSSSGRSVPISTGGGCTRRWSTGRAALTVAGHPVAQDFAQIWQAADKIVYSRTLETVSSARTRIEHEFDAGAIRRRKEGAGRDLTVGGPHLAAEALRAGLVDELQLFVVPVVVGGGNRALPDDVSVRLELLEERRFRNGTVYLRYRTAR